MKKLTFLSFGAGQDSTYILYRIFTDPLYRERFAPGKLVIVMSDTGDEHAETYQHVKFISGLCASKGVEFQFLTSDMGFHPRTWPDLLSQLRRNNTIMSLMMPRSCTDNLKIKPIYNFINIYIGNYVYGQNLTSSTRNKTWIKKFAADYGKINVILGIAAGEEKRIKASKKEQLTNQLALFGKKLNSRSTWMKQCIAKIFPMIAEGINRQQAQDYILSTPWPLPPPSNCKHCPFLSKQEILWMYRFIPQDFHDWVVIEQAKIDKCCGRGRNLGVKGEKLLPQILREAIEEFGHWTDSQLQDYKMSHGHCVKSNF